MDNTSDPAVLFKGMIDRLSAQMHVDAFILFGSRATNRASVNSDYDVVVIGDFTGSRFDRVVQVLRCKPRVPVDVFCFTPREFEQAFRSFDLTAIDAVGEGLTLHGNDYIKPYKARHERLA